jgi:hypothetical protein
MFLVALIYHHDLSLLQRALLGWVLWFDRLPMGLYNIG